MNPSLARHMIGVDPTTLPFPHCLQPVFLAEWVDTDPPPRVWQVDGLIARGAVTSLYGHGGAGKSMLAIDLMLEVARKGQWLGRDVQRGMTLGIFAEDDQHELVRRTKRMAAAKNMDLLQYASAIQLVSLVGEDSTLIEFPPDDRIPYKTPLFERLEELIEEHFPKLLVLDYAAALFGGNEVSRAQVGAFMRELNGLAMKRDLAIILLGHPSAEGLKNGRGFSGSTAWHNQARAFLHLETLEDQSDPEGRTLCTVSVRKNNYGRSGDVIKMAFDGTSFEVLEQSKPGPKVAKGPRLTNAQRVCLKALQRAIDDDGQPSPGGSVPNSVRVVAKIDLWREYAYSAGVSASNEESSRRRAFYDCRLALQNKGLVGLLDPYAWLA